MKLAMPKPCGIRSNQRWRADESSSQKVTRRLARMVKREETRVRVYNFPVRRIILYFFSCVINVNEKETNHPARTLPVEMATYGWC
jgi:hypothetical protein